MSLLWLRWCFDGRTGPLTSPGHWRVILYVKTLSSKLGVLCCRTRKTFHIADEVTVMISTSDVSDCRTFVIRRWIYSRSCYRRNRRDVLSNVYHTREQAYSDLASVLWEILNVVLCEELAIDFNDNLPHQTNLQHCRSCKVQSKSILLPFFSAQYCYENSL